MTTGNINRYRVSTKFTLAKIIILAALLLIGYNLIVLFRNNTFTSMPVAGLTFGLLILAGIYYYITTRKQIDYDDINQILYIVDTKRKTETAITVEKIDEILYSVVGVQWQSSYIIVYRDYHNQRQKARLFPIPFDSSIDTIIADAKLKNPDLVTRKWSFGWNELFD